MNLNELLDKFPECTKFEICINTKPNEDDIKNLVQIDKSDCYKYDCSDINIIYPGLFEVVIILNAKKGI